MKNTLETRLGLFFALALVAAFLILEMLGGFSFFQKGYRLNALFNNVQELKVGDPVKMAGVNIGRIDAVALTNTQVRVTLQIFEQTTQIRTDSKATIKFVGLLGQNFVAVDFGTSKGAVATDGAFLQSVEQPDLSQLMAKLDNVASGVENITRSFSGDTFNNLLGPVTDFLKQNQQPLTDSIANMRTISQNIVEGKGTVGKLINEPALYDSAMSTLSTLQTNLADMSGELNATLADARATVADMRAGKGTIGKLMTDESLFTETKDAMTQMKEIMQKINHGEGTIGQLVNDQSLLKNVKLSLQKLDKATEGLEDTGPLQVIGIMAGQLF
jgi:phospholipid/cholesterol/gamma-HCH transport system substrate-binding protein